MEMILQFGRLLTVIYLSGLLCILLLANRAIFQPQPPSYRDDRDIIKLVTADGVSIAALHLPTPGAAFTILYSHGNGEDLGDILPVLREFQRRGYSVFAYDYHGYGLSGGTPTEQNSYRDIEAAYTCLTTGLKVPPEAIIAHGYSVGSGPSVELALRHRVGGVVIESGFISAFRTVTRIKLFPFDRFMNLEKVPRLEVPLLVIHGDQDQVIPFAHGKRLYAAASGPRLFLPVEGAGHYDLRERAGEGYWDAYADLGRLVVSSHGHR